MSQYKAYTAYKDSGIEWIGQVPKHWGIPALKFLLSNPITDGPHETPVPADPQDGIVFISAEAVSSGRINFSRAWGYISRADHKRYSRKYKPQQGDIYMVKSGATTGITAMVEDNREFNIWSPLAAIRANSETAPKFLLYALRSTEFQVGITLNWSYGTQQNIGMNVLENLPLPIPPYKEQATIAATLDQETARIDALIEKKTRFIELLKEKRQALITHAVTKGLDPNAEMKESGIEWIGQVPEHWEVKPFKHILYAPMSYGANESAESDDLNHPRYIRITDMTENGTLRKDTFKTLPWDEAYRYLLSDGDILLARSGATVGKSFLYKETNGVACFAGYLIKASCDEEKALPKYIYAYLQSHSYWEYISGSNIQSTIQNVSAEKYSSMVLPVPPLEEQVMIAATLDRETARIDALIGKAQQSITLLEERRSAFITAAVTGQIDLRGEQ